MGYIFGFFAILAIIPVLIVAVVLLVLQHKKNKEAEALIMNRKKAYSYCRNCGRPLISNASICTNCGVKVGMGNHYCWHCGGRTDEIAAVCVKCGTSLTSMSSYEISGKSKVVAGILGIFLGEFGIHNFYLGYTLKAVAQVLLTVFFIMSSIFIVGVIFMCLWGFVEGVMILAGGISKDADGGLLI